MNHDNLQNAVSQDIWQAEQTDATETASQSVSEPSAKPLAVIFMPEREFLLPYFRRRLPEYDVTASMEDATGRTPELAVMVSSTDIYNVKSGIGHTEQTPLPASSPWREKENAWSQWCADNSLPVTVVRCPEVIGTGMHGLAMRLARGIARGTLLHIRGNQGLISLIHAVDVAALAIRPELQGHTVNLTDGTETSMDSLIDALAFRLDNKRVLTIKWPQIARAIYGAEFYEDLTRSLTFSNALSLDLLGSSAVLHPVTEYLRTHVYDEDSL